MKPFKIERVAYFEGGLRIIRFETKENLTPSEDIGVLIVSFERKISQLNVTPIASPNGGIMMGNDLVLQAGDETLNTTLKNLNTKLNRLGV